MSVIATYINIKERIAIVTKKLAPYKYDVCFMFSLKYETISIYMKI